VAIFLEEMLGWLVHNPVFRLQEIAELNAFILLSSTV
jgi:hypothetical protein